jgi:hypothetical protein
MSFLLLIPLFASNGNEPDTVPSPLHILWQPLHNPVTKATRRGSWTDSGAAFMKGVAIT